MLNIKKIKWIPILMTLSQLMLTGFVVYWLRSQYQDEKDVLRDDLSRIYDESLNQVMDSVVFSTVIEPALSDSVTITLSADRKKDTLVNFLPKRATRSAYFSNKGYTENTVVEVAKLDSITGKGPQKAAVLAFPTRKQDMLIRSVKLIINHSEDSTESKNSLRMGFPLALDSVLFKKFFTEKAVAKNMGISLHWHSDSLAQAKHARESVLYFSGMMPGQLPGVLIKNEAPYLVSRMSPQILFGLILLLLTGSAFYFTNRSLKRQMMLNSLRNDFVSNITHELRTPVSTVKVALEALKTFDKVNNPAITLDYLDMATQEMNRLDQLISKVLDQSLIGEQNNLIQPQPADLKELIGKTLVTLEPRLTARNARISFDSTEPIGLIMVDPLYFQGILMNLIDNSLKYGNEAPEIAICLRQNKSSVVVEVGDNGPGIPKEYLGKVFDKFFRVPKGDTHNIKGYGLGLSFAALVMNQHQGSIAVKNLDQGGCLFTLTFPLKTV
jgi:signal transduction histidine kinase